MEYNEIISKFENKEINFQDAFIMLAQIGHCPCLLNDDNRHWAVTFDGFQTVVCGDKTEDISTYFFIEADCWKDTMDEALLYAFKS